MARAGLFRNELPALDRTHARGCLGLLCLRGVNTATWSGRELARWLAGNESSNDLLPKHLPAIVRGRPPRFPLAFLRRQYLRAGLGFYRLRDFFDI